MKDKPIKVPSFSFGSQTVLRPIEKSPDRKPLPNWIKTSQDLIKFLKELQKEQGNE